MNLKDRLLTPDDRDELAETALVRGRLEVQFANLEEQHEASALGMWVFLATEVMFFGALFVGVAVYRYKYPVAFEHASARLNLLIGGINTVVLLVSSLFMVLAVHYAKHGDYRRVTLFLWLTVALGTTFLVLKGCEYYDDYKENLIPGWRFDGEEWIQEGLQAKDVPHVQLFLLFYWIMTGFHAVHMTIGILAVLAMIWLTRRGVFTPEYYSPLDVTGLYWHFVDTVWIFLLPMLYLLGTHSLADLHFIK
jgi:cytochrome c oxidase subunit 3